MTTILIADASKPSVVMTSEIFKDKIPGAVVSIAQTGAQALEKIAQQKPDMIVVDFDLPDVDGPALIEAIRRSFDGPVLLTAYPDAMVKQAVTDHLFTYNDASSWLAKPVKFDELSQKIDKFLVERHRLAKRFDTAYPALLVGKAAGRGKRAPKVNGRIINISLGGACIAVDGSTAKLKKAQEFVLTLPATAEDEVAAPTKPSTTAVSAKKTTAAKKTSGVTAKKKAAAPETKVKATVAWISPSGQIGLSFGKLTDVQRKGLELLLKTAS